MSHNPPPQSRHRRRQHSSTGSVEWTDDDTSLEETSPSLTTREPSPDDQPFDDFNMAARDGSPMFDDGQYVATVTHTIYKTLAPSFDGPIGGYSTLFDNDGLSPVTAAQLAMSPGPTLQHANAAAVALSTLSPAQPDQMATKAATPEFASSLGAPLSNPTLTQPAESLTAASSAQSTSTSLGSSQSSADQSMRQPANGNEQGNTAGAKAGIAFGIIGSIAALALFVFFLARYRRKQQPHYKLDDYNEKALATRAGPNPFDTPVMRCDPKAPRISLRHVDNILPNWNAEEKRTSRAAHSVAIWNSSAGSQTANSVNPFGPHAERFPSPIVEEKGMRRLSGSPGLARAVPYGQDTLHARTHDRNSGPARVTSMHRDAVNVDLTLSGRNGTPPSPADTEFSMSSIASGSVAPMTNSAVAIAVAGGPAASGVHRIELDFKPTLDDEIALRIGDLVRLLHEYDDGWCLVIRLDRSEQGVVPRTCLSTRPVKPRLPPGAPRPGPPVNPSGQMRGPNAMNGSRTATPDVQGRLRGMQNPGAVPPGQGHSVVARRQVAPPHRPGAPPLGPPPGPLPNGPLPGIVGRKPVPVQQSGPRAAWPMEQGPWVQ
ncbi:hypothetical protein HIM_01416 [Hirsutella minnesotensis 3608]|nr:hypothetical protein HIM_01416 [Hirsutella minnesotensis 3608]